MNPIEHAIALLLAVWLAVVGLVIATAVQIAGM